MFETKIYVGLNDSVTKKQIYEDSKYISILKSICINYQVCFSIIMEHGGYIHDNGEYVEEKTLVVTLLDTEEETVQEIAKDLCVFFNQESVMITVGEVKMYYIKEHLQE